MRALIVIAALFLGFTAPALAAEDATGQAVIRSQEQAMTRDDAAAAYSFAAPAIQTMFGNPDTFMQMVRKGYAPVYRHRRFTFGESTTEGGTIKQLVHIVDADGVAWEALYTLERQSDGSLKISGCALTKAVTA